MPRDLHLASPLTSGPDVLKVQQKLKTLGYSPGVLDGKYGATTAAAVKAFQKARKLKQDGVVGQATRAALVAAKPAVTAPKPPAKSKGLRALAEAVKHIGVKESPAGSNRQKFGAWFGVNGVQWCAIFTSFCFNVGAGVTLCKGSRGLGVYSKGTTYVPTLEAWLRSTGQWIGRTTPSPGDIAIFNWDGGAADHVGIVERYVGGGQFDCIEGNTGIGADSDGGEVMRRRRYISQVDGFGRIK